MLSIHQEWIPKMTFVKGGDIGCILMMHIGVFKKLGDLNSKLNQ
jgi:hypothetical protein